MDEFDRMLYQGAAQMPPELAGEEPPKPWKGPLKRICWGLGLVSITLNFLYLDTILPVVGVVLLWLGLRALRRENGGFHFAYVCAAIYAVLRLAAVVVLATPLETRIVEQVGMDWHNTTGNVSFYYVLKSTVIHLLLVLTVGGLWQGLKAVFVGAGQKPKTRSAGALVVLEALLLPLALIGVSGWLLVGPLLVIWILLVRSLFQISRSLDQAGYALRPAPVKVSNPLAAAIWLGIPLLAVAVLPFLFARMPVRAQTAEPVVTERTELRRELLEMGFPETILSALTDEEVARFEGAYGVTVKDSGGGAGGLPHVGIVEIPVRDDYYGFRTVYLACFSWEDMDERYAEGIGITPDVQGVTVRVNGPEGVLRWEEEGVRYAMPLDFRFRSDGSWIASYYADFSLPKCGGEVAGYVFWEDIATHPTKPMLYNYRVSCIHRAASWQYPYQLPSDVLLSGGLRVGWRSWDWVYTGLLAPEGQYEYPY